MNKPKLNDDFHTKMFTSDMKGNFEIYVAFNEVTEEKKKQVLKELDNFSDKLDGILRK